ncbi:hypothetical protein [Lutibaculum baratangense]|uniref:Uncharacterized protein n=1 Tax=Lutibaculum baratangense AMV1 TaxID=631454 RepID=V4RKM7_9HYPH|nr:hypothetical protein [Lutibaculum baratangense]ESR26611.1 hypothetical protein N177_0830 [Lutibaculum baratangense AMV1]
MTFVVAFAVADLSYDLIRGGWLLATVQIAGVTGRLAWGFIADRSRSAGALLSSIGLVESVPSDANPRTGRITALSVVAALRGLVSPLRVGT